jgi:protease-4
MQSKTKLLLWITALGLLILGLGVGGLVLVLSDVPQGMLPSETRELHIRLAGPIPDGPGEGEFSLDPERFTVYVPDYARAIRAAAEDHTIGSLRLELDSPSLSMAAAQEIRAALLQFEATEKGCVAWAKAYDNLAYYLASACSEVSIHPQGTPMVIGLKVKTRHFAETLAWIGLEPDFERIGDYKSAPEAYTRTEPSDPAKEMMESLLDDLANRFVQDIADSRGQTVDRVQEWIDDPPVTATAAVDRGLIDSMRHLDDLESGEEEHIRPYLTRLDRRNRGFQPQVAILHVQGTIVDGRSDSGGFGGGNVSGDRTVVAHLEELRDDPSVAAIVLRVNSPGGSAMASDVIWRAVKQANAAKPVVVSMGSVAASGGYYISAPARRIFVQPGTITGSIGIFAGKLSAAGLYKKLGITSWSSERGAMAGLYDSDRSFTEAERAKIKERISDFYDTFLEKVAQGREMTPESIHEVAQGRVWTGSQAIHVGLADEIGGLEEAIAWAAEAAGLEPESYGRMLRPAAATFFEALLSKFESDPDAMAQIARLGGDEVRKALDTWVHLAPILEQDGLAAALPFSFQIR